MPVRVLTVTICALIPSLALLLLPTAWALAFVLTAAADELLHRLLVRLHHLPHLGSHRWFLSPYVPREFLPSLSYGEMTFEIPTGIQTSYRPVCRARATGE